jgi:hypothetical protein
MAPQLTGHTKQVCARMPFKGLNYGLRAPFTAEDMSNANFDSLSHKMTIVVHGT